MRREKKDILPKVGIDCGCFRCDKEDGLPIFVCQVPKQCKLVLLTSWVHQTVRLRPSPHSLRLWGFKRILVWSHNLPSIQLMLMSSPKGDRAAHGLAEVGVLEIEAHTLILRSQLVQRLRNWINEKDA